MSSPTLYESVSQKFEVLQRNISFQVNKLPEDTKAVLAIALPAIAVASVLYATAPATILFVAAVITGHKLANGLISRKAVGRVLMAVGSTIFAVKIAIPFSTTVGYAAGSAALVYAGFYYNSNGSLPGSNYINNFLNSEQPRARKV